MALDLSQSIVHRPASMPREQERAVAMLVEEIETRTRLRLPVQADLEVNGPVVAIWAGEAREAGTLTEEAREALTQAASLPAEGYRLRSRGEGAAGAVVAAGADGRGLLFGIGRLLRSLRMLRDCVTLPAALEIGSSPRYPLRGHQLGYRPKTNAYDGWDLRIWEQYYRDLVLFGANAVELIPPRSDDAPDSPHFPLPPLEMMKGMSQLAADYGLDVWIWFPAMDANYADTAVVDAAVEEWAGVLRELPRVDALFVPGGDPGHTSPRALMSMLARQTESLQRIHPRAGMWVSPQGFRQIWLSEFVQILRDEQPDWLSGVVFGPQVRVPLPELRDMVPARYPIRHYPDITHSRECQYPVPEWDLAYGITEGREGINPRPKDMAAIHSALAENTVGFITYSEGCNDDVNKAVWSGLGWDPDRPVLETLREFARVFIGPEHEEGFAQGTLALERNWRGPLLTNDGVETTLQQFQVMERAASPRTLQNWRFQQALYRAYYDAYLRRRLIYETGLERLAEDELRRAPAVGAAQAMARAREILSRSVLQPVAQDLRARVFELAEALFQSIHMQLSVGRYAAIAVDRGANLDAIDEPLTHAPWLLAQFHEIERMAREAERLKAIDSLLRWRDPGPGGFYDEPGNPCRRDHLVRGPGFEADPGCYRSARTGFSDSVGRITWARCAETLWDTPLVMRYEGLDASARYRVREAFGNDSPGYGDENPEDGIRLVSGSGVEIHPPLIKPAPVRPVEYAIPPQAIVDGALELQWVPVAGRGGNGRGCQLSEVWLIRQDA